MSLPDTSTAAQPRNPRREAILDAAELLLKRDEDGDGLPPLSFADVAAETGMARSSLYRYFTGVEDLIEAVSMRNMLEWAADAQRAANSLDGDVGSIERLRAWCRAAILTAPQTDYLWREQLVRIHLDEAARRRISEFQDGATAHVDAFIDGLDDVPDTRRALLSATIREAVGTAVRLSSMHPDESDRIASWFSVSLDAIVGSIRSEGGDAAG